MHKFIEAILDRTRPNPFLDDLRVFHAKVAAYGVYNSLSQLVCKIATPGVPDFYQGTELWDFSLVDPDNRRLVDYDHRMRVLEEVRQAIEVAEDRRAAVRKVSRLAYGWPDQALSYDDRLTLSSRSSPTVS